MDEFTRRSGTYRSKYNAAINGLYGEKMDIPPKPAKAPKTRKVKRKPKTTPEYIIQCKLVAWAKNEALDLISIPNAGRRSYWQGQKEVAMGLTKGVSDLFLAQPSNGHHGFWIELKREGERPKPEQLAWLTKMQQRGYMAAWYDDWEVARDAIIKYLGK